MPVIRLTKKVKDEVREVSRSMGVNEREVIDRAIMLYLASAKAILDLEREFSAWDALSDEAFSRMSRKMTPGIL